MIDFKMKDVVKLHKTDKFLCTFSPDTEIKVQVVGKKGVKKKETKILNKIAELNRKRDALIAELFGNEG